jgi:hypothetical protein
MKKPPYVIHVKKIIFGDWIDGITIYPFIFIKKKERTEDEYRTILEHEKIHIRQQLDGWLIGFYIKYLYYNWRFGYKRNPYEIEAYKHQDDWKKEEM